MIDAPLAHLDDRCFKSNGVGRIGYICVNCGKDEVQHIHRLGRDWCPKPAVGLDDYRRCIACGDRTYCASRCIKCRPSVRVSPALVQALEDAFEKED